MKPAKPENPEAYGVVSFSYGKIILPLADATRLMDCFSRAEKFETCWKGDKAEDYIGGKLPSITMDLLSGTEWLAAKLNGEKE